MRVISVTGGKGGIGKTTISVNLALAFAKMKKKVLLFDADLGLANVDVMLGLTPQHTTYDVLSGARQLHEICLEGPYGLKVIPSASGFQKMADLSALEYVELIRSFSSLTEKVDVMIVDMASGISKQVIDFTHAAQDILVVICNDPASLMDGYAVIKILHQQYGRRQFGIVVNKVSHAQEGAEVFSRFQQAVAKFITISMHYLGSIPTDDYIQLAARERISVVQKYPQAKSVLALNQLCKNITTLYKDNSLNGGIHFFFEQLLKNQEHAVEQL